MNKEIPVFFAVDNGYIPFLGVALKSLIDNTSKENKYAIKILYTSVTEENKKRIKKYEQENVTIEFVDLNKQLNEIKEKLYTRNYFSNTTYYRLFIPELYPEYDKVVYIDSDTICLSDIANLYNIDMGDNLIAAVPDGAVQAIDVFKDYVERVVGVADYNKYFNAGVIVMNLKELREYKFEEKGDTTKLDVDVSNYFVKSLDEFYVSSFQCYYPPYYINTWLHSRHLDVVEAS